MGRFSIRTLLFVIALVSICILAITNPTKLWGELFGIALGAIILVSIAIAIGAQGRLRLQIISFALVLAIAVISDNKFATSRLVQSKSSLIYSLSESLATGKPELSPKGDEVRYFRRDGSREFQMRNRTSESEWTYIDAQEVVDLGLYSIAYDYDNPVSTQHLFDILNVILALLLGLVGFFITGFVYDRRDASGNEREEPNA